MDVLLSSMLKIIQFQEKKIKPGGNCIDIPEIQLVASSFDKIAEFVAAKIKDLTSYRKKPDLLALDSSKSAVGADRDSHSATRPDFLKKHK